ncbi:mCG1027775 [Mus musculus]|nr:mCG1027775 [Mus musculus]
MREAQSLSAQTGSSWAFKQICQKPQAMPRSEPRASRRHPLCSRDGCTPAPRSSAWTPHVHSLSRHWVAVLMHSDQYPHNLICLPDVQIVKASLYLVFPQCM